MTQSISRRGAFRAAAVVAGTIASFRLAGPSLAQNQSPDTSGKLVTKEAAQYRDQPNGQQSCNQCANFMAPTGCKVVQGTVAANGWCRLFQAKSS